MSIQSLDNDPETVPVKPAKTITKRSKSTNGCGCTTGCKRVCGCRRQGMQCSEQCNCKMQCHNIFNLVQESSSVGSKRERSTDEETVASADNVENKENIDEVVPCTPKRQWYVICLFYFE